MQSWDLRQVEMFHQSGVLLLRSEAKRSLSEIACVFANVLDEQRLASLLQRNLVFPSDPTPLCRQEGHKGNHQKVFSQAVTRPVGQLR